MADPLTVFAIGDIDELGLRGVVLRGTDPEAIREVGRHLHEPVVVVPVEQLKQVVEALTLILGQPGKGGSDGLAATK
jgi:predicted nucleotidyltransferase